LSLTLARHSRIRCSTAFLSVVLALMLERAKSWSYPLASRIIILSISAKTLAIALVPRS
jgi:hypothetical protein